MLCVARHTAAANSPCVAVGIPPRRPPSSLDSLRLCIEESAQPSLKTIDVFDFALPDHDHSPAKLSKCRLLKSIARGIPIQLRKPPLATVGRCGAVATPFVAMPEASMNEDCRLVSGQEDIDGNVTGLGSRVSSGSPDGNRHTDVQAEAITHPMQKRADDLLRPGILAADARHIPATPGLAEAVTIHHGRFATDGRRWIQVFCRNPAGRKAGMTSCFARTPCSSTDRRPFRG